MTWSSSQPVVGFFYTPWQLTAVPLWLCVSLLYCYCDTCMGAFKWEFGTLYGGGKVCHECVCVSQPRCVCMCSSAFWHYNVSEMFSDSDNPKNSKGGPQSAHLQLLEMDLSRLYDDRSSSYTQLDKSTTCCHRPFESDKTQQVVWKKPNISAAVDYINVWKHIKCFIYNTLCFRMFNICISVSVWRCNCDCVLTCLFSSRDCRSFSAVQQLSIHTYLILRVGLQVVETVSAGSSAQLRLLFLTICGENTNIALLSFRKGRRFHTDVVLALWGNV